MSSVGHFIGVLKQKKHVMINARLFIIYNDEGFWIFSQPLAFGCVLVVSSKKYGGLFQLKGIRVSNNKRKTTESNINLGKL